MFFFKLLYIFAVVIVYKFEYKIKSPHLITAFPVDVNCDWYAIAVQYAGIT